MKILLVTGPDITLRQPFNSGIESFVVTLANKLVIQGHTVDVIARDAEPDVLFNVITLPTTPFAALYGPWLSKGRLEQSRLRHLSQMDMSSYDVIHHNLFIPEVYQIARAFDKPSVLTLHSPVDDVRSQTYRSFARHADVSFVAISDRIRQQWSPALRTDMPVLHNGINIDQWPLHAQTPRGYMLWTGRINSLKNPAAAIQLARHTGRKLIMAGRIVDQHYFDTEVKPFLNDDIQYIGHATQQEISALARNASVFLATAQWCEPFGLAALEMLASGLPVIGFESAIPSDLRKEGISVTTPAADWPALVPLLQQIVKATPTACRNFALTMDDSTMAYSYASLYETVCARYRPAITDFEPEYTGEESAQPVLAH